MCSAGAPTAFEPKREEHVLCGSAKKSWGGGIYECVLTQVFAEEDTVEDSLLDSDMAAPLAETRDERRHRRCAALDALDGDARERRRCVAARYDDCALARFAARWAGDCDGALDAVRRDVAWRADARHFLSHKPAPKDTENVSSSPRLSRRVLVVV